MQSGSTNKKQGLAMYIKRVSIIILFNILLSGCAGLVVGGSNDRAGNDNRSAEVIKSDSRITRSINRAYVKDESIPSLDIRVTTFRGVVTLSGKVPTDRVKSKAISIAKNTSGVRKVKSSLKVSGN
jgi:hypothetical protein